MYTQKVEQIFKLENLKDAFFKISSSSKGLDEVSFYDFKKELTKNLKLLQEEIIKGNYTPEPHKKIEIKKLDKKEKRPIGLASIKDKIVQKVLVNTLNIYFDKNFSNKSYAYRPNKSTLKAINRTATFLNEKNHWILKSDISNFFEEINHEKLLLILEKSIQDKRVLRLISLFLQTGSFKNMDYNKHKEGVHQGDILSPLLSNIYLDQMDKFLDKYEIPFVRYADDFVILFKKEKDARVLKDKLSTFLKALNLSLGEEKTQIVHINKGFNFLGVNFLGKSRVIENERFLKTISKIHSFSKTKISLYEFTKELNTYLYTLKNYYLKLIIKNSKQHKLLQEAFLEAISNKIYHSKRNKEIKTKKEFKIVLEKIEWTLLFDEEERDIKIELVLTKAYEKYLSNKSYSDVKTKIDKKKNKYAKEFANSQTLHITTSGMFLGISKNKFVLKQYGKVQKSFPKDKINRIIFEGKGYSFSSDVIKKCADMNITIDFIDRKAMPYASLITYKSSLSQTVSKQARVLNTPKHLELAKEFIKSKAKNQINYIKYLDKYHKQLEEKIAFMQKNFKSIKKAKSQNELMGYEGVISSSYWECLKLILEVPFEKRVTFGAKDIVNSSLNYAYAILYGKIQHCLVHAGLSLNISFLHALDNKKPTLTFDMIEEFRSFVVDRTIVSMLNKDEPISLNNEGLLTKKSRELISKNIKEKLGSYTMWKKESTKVENIIQTQCYSLAKYINDELEKYKGFVGKY